ncbi:MAG: DUF4421 family protein [Bdellovibrionota bacterium]
MRRWLFTFLIISLFIAGTTVWAEDVPEEGFSAPELTGMIAGTLEFPVYSFYFGAPDINGNAYVPNFSPRAGTMVRWNTYQLALSVGLPLPQEEKDRRGNTDQSNLVLTRYWRAFGADIYYQKYLGLYIASPLTELDFHKPTRYPRLPEASIKNYGINLYQNVNPETYSLKAAFNQTEFQTNSGGSFLITAFYNHLEMNMGTVLEPGSEPGSVQSLPNIESGTFETYGGGLGYGYLWVDEERFLAIQGIGGTGAQIQHINQAQGDIDHTWSLAFKANLNVALGYNRKDSAFGAKLLVDSLSSNVRGVQFYSTLINGLLFYGKRF